MSFTNNALHVADNANYRFNPAKQAGKSPNHGTAIEPFQYGDVMAKKARWGANIHTNGEAVSSLDECKAKCDAESACKGFTIKRDNSWCYTVHDIPQSDSLSPGEDWDTYVAYPNYTDINTSTIDPIALNDVNTHTLDNINNNATATDQHIESVKIYQNTLATQNAVKQTLLDEINSNLNYTVMAMTIWVPLGILAGYYLYKKNVGVPQSA
jgi:hypothetical protein